MSDMETTTNREPDVDELLAACHEGDADTARDLDADALHIREEKGIVDPDPPKQKRRRKLEPSTEAATNVQALDIEKAPTLALARSSDVQALDTDQARRSVDEVNEGWKRMELRAYAVGSKLNAMRVGGAPKALGYGTWDAMVDAEIHVPRSTAYLWMQIAEAFTEEQFRALGGTRAGLLVRLPAEQRTAIVPEAMKLSTRDLEARIKAPRALAPKPSDQELLEERKRQRKEASERPSERKQTGTDVAERENANLAAKGREAFTFCFEGDDDGTIVDDFPVYRPVEGSKKYVEEDKDASDAKLDAAKRVVVDRGSEVGGVIYFVLQDRNGRHLRFEVDQNHDNAIRVTAEKPTEEEDEEDDEHEATAHVADDELPEFWSHEKVEREMQRNAERLAAFLKSRAS